MVAIKDNTTVAELASAVPGSVRVFQQFGIDFCCGGNKTLAQACKDTGVSLEGVLAGIVTADHALAGVAETDWNSKTLTDLIAHILSKHHAYLHSEMPRLDAMIAKVFEAHSKNHADTLRPLAKTFAALRRELEEHMWKEENILFPLIQQIEKAQSTPGASRPGMPVGGPIRMMEFEHESAGNALREIRRVTSDYTVPQDGCNTYRALFDGLQTLEADLHQHIHLENNILFPRTLAIAK